MDFNDTPAEAKFREESRAWLKANIPTEAELEGLDYIGRAKLWQKRKYVLRMLRSGKAFETTNWSAMDSSSD